MGYLRKKKKNGRKGWEIFVLEKPLKFPGSYFIQGVIIVFQLERDRETKEHQILLF